MTFVANDNNHLPRQHEDNDTQSRASTHKLLPRTHSFVWFSSCVLLQAGIRLFFLEFVLNHPVTLVYHCQKSSLSWDWATCEKKWQMRRANKGRDLLCRWGRRPWRIKAKCRPENNSSSKRHTAGTQLRSPRARQHTRENSPPSSWTLNTAEAANFSANVWVQKHP